MTPAIKIERAKPQDCEGICEVLLKAFTEFRERYTKEAFDATVISPESVLKRMKEGPVWVAKLDEKIVGTVSLRLLKNEGYLRGMAVLPSAQGLKIGLALLMEAEKFAKETQYRRLFLKTTPYLERAIRLYGQFGFTRVQEETGDFYGTPVITMEKNLEIMTDTKLDFQIIDYRPEHKQRWKEINEAWITKSFWMEDIDIQHCSFPEESILTGGGQILLATVEGRVVGTAGLLKDNPDTYELIKMAVDEEYQGFGIGRALCRAAIERAEKKGATLLYLFSNTGGSPTAIGLYGKLGFREVPLDRQDFARADIRMEMWFPEALEKLQYPVGRDIETKEITGEIWQSWILAIATLPALLEETLAGMTDEQLDTPYRPGGWTVRQLVHHIADSHMNAHCRMRLALTEDNPVIKPYEQDEWSKLQDGNEMPVGYSLDILRGLHARWAFLLKNISGEDLKRTYFHPERGKTFSVQTMTDSYAWHCRHHLAHIAGLKKRYGWG